MNHVPIILGVGELAVIRTPGGLIKTIGLGSCVGLTLHDPVSGAVGLAHIALPDSSISSKSREYPRGYFADEALPLLFKAMDKTSGLPSGQRYQAKLIGGANMKGIANIFDIGVRNVQEVRRLLNLRGMSPVSEEIGGHISRTVWVQAGTGKVVVETPGLKARQV